MCPKLSLEIISGSSHSSFPALFLPCLLPAALPPHLRKRLPGAPVPRHCPCPMGSIARPSLRPPISVQAFLCPVDMARTVLGLKEPVKAAQMSPAPVSIPSPHVYP